MALTPLDSRTNDRLLRTVRDSVLANLSGMLAVIVAQGLLLSLGFWFIGVHSPVLWGMIGGLASIVPVVGAFLIWAPVAIAYVLEEPIGRLCFWSSGVPSWWDPRTTSCGPG